MSLYEKILTGEEKIALIGLGYVGMPIAVAFAKKVKVIGFDLNRAKIDLYKSGVDPTKEVGDEASLRNAFLETVIFQLQRTVPLLRHGFCWVRALFGKKCQNRLQLIVSYG